MFVERDMLGEWTLSGFAKNGDLRSEEGVRSVNYPATSWSTLYA